MHYPPTPKGMSDEAWRYLCDLRSLPFEEFRSKYERNLNGYLKH